jgi:hypothetical protein
LSNSNKFGLVPTYGRKAIEKGRCKVPSRGGILAIKKWLVGLQNLWDNNQDIYTKVFEQPTTIIKNNPWPMHLTNQNYKTCF